MNDAQFSILVSETVSDIVETFGLDSTKWRHKIYDMLVPKFSEVRQSKGSAEQQSAVAHQQLKAAIALLNRWVSVVSDKNIMSDTYHFLSNDATSAV